MDKSFVQQDSQTQQRRSFLAGLPLLGRFENWLRRVAQLTELTEEEQRDAGIRLRQWAEEEQIDPGIHPGDERGT